MEKKQNEAKRNNQKTQTKIKPNHIKQTKQLTVGASWHFSDIHR